MRNQQDSPEPSAASSSSSAVPVAAPPTPQSTRRLLGKVTLRGQTWLVLYMPRHVCEWFHFRNGDKVPAFSSKNSYYYSFHEEIFYIDGHSKAEEVDLKTMDRNEMAGWLGFERAVEALGEDLNGDLHKVIASVARDFFEQRCEFCEGTGMTNAHARIVVWENEIAKRFTRVSGTDKLGVAKLANKLLPIEICGVCRGSTVRRSGAGLGEVLEAAQKGSSTAAKKVKAGA